MHERFLLVQKNGHSGDVLFEGDDLEQIRDFIDQKEGNQDDLFDEEWMF